jgi:hypothetical protein
VENWRQNICNTCKQSFLGGTSRDEILLFPTFGVQGVPQLLVWIWTDKFLTLNCMDSRHIPAFEWQNILQILSIDQMHSFVFQIFASPECQTNFPKYSWLEKSFLESYVLSIEQHFHSKSFIFSFFANYQLSFRIIFKNQEKNITENVM